MKKIFAVVLALTMVFALAGCGSKKTDEEATTAGAETTTAAGEETTAAGEETTTAGEETTTAGEESTTAGEEKAEVMSYEQFMAAAVDDAVIVETYVQAKQSWWEDKATVYTQTEDGAYFLYNMACSEEDYAKLEKGTKIRVTGYKAEFSGEIEIADATFEILEGNYVAEATDVTAKLGNEEELIKDMNKFVTFKGAKVLTASDDTDATFLYKWDGSGKEGDDLYFRVEVDGKTYTFTVESYLCEKDTDVYKAVKELKAGDVVDMEGFLYWYEGVNPHITSVTVK